MRRFLAADSKRKWAVFHFNLSCHCYLYIAKFLSSVRDDCVKNLGDTTLQACEICISGCRPRLKDVAC